MFFETTTPFEFDLTKAAIIAVIEAHTRTTDILTESLYFGDVLNRANGTELYRVYQENDIATGTPYDAFLVCRLVRERRVLPGSVVDEVVAQRIEQIEDQQGRALSKADRKLVVDDVNAELLLQAFIIKMETHIAFDFEKSKVYFGSTDAGLILEFIKLFPINAVTKFRTVELPSAALFGYFNNGVFPSDLRFYKSITFSDNAGRKKTFTGNYQTIKPLVDAYTGGTSNTRLASMGLLSMDGNDRVFFMTSDMAIRAYRYLFPYDVRSMTKTELLDFSVTSNVKDLQTLYQDFIDRFSGISYD